MTGTLARICVLTERFCRLLTCSGDRYEDDRMQMCCRSSDHRVIGERASGSATCVRRDGLPQRGAGRRQWRRLRRGSGRFPRTERAAWGGGVNVFYGQPSGLVANRSGSAPVTDLLATRRMAFRGQCLSSPRPPAALLSAVTGRSAFRDPKRSLFPRLAAAPHPAARVAV